MSKKDRMLSYITDNVKWFMTTSTSVEVIPYYELSTSVFNRAKKYFAKDAQYEDVVCLISTSVLETGKSGILFTTEYVYSKAWGGILTGVYKNWIFSSFSAEFDIINEFDTERMKQLMSDLADISIEEDDREELDSKIENAINTIEEVGKVVGAAALGGMALADIISSIGDSVVCQNNETIANEIASLENSNDEQTKNILEIYKEFIPLINEFAEILVDNQDDDDIDVDTSIAIIKKLNEILLELYYQASSNINVSIDDIDEYTKFSEWITFWALMFYDADQFRETYSLEILQEMPECWDAIAELTDTLLEDEGWEDSFSDILFDFAETVIDNVNQSVELLSNSEWDEEFSESMMSLVQSNISSVARLTDALNRATDYIMQLLPSEEED